jgi:uncharacterized protein YjbI with pentapeptide repeats
VGSVVAGALVLGTARRAPNYNYADLSGMSLPRRHWAHGRLANTDLQGADLHTSDLRGADLSHACLRGADLRDADLRGADLASTNLSDADLRGARLDGTNLEGSLFSRGTLWPQGFEPRLHGGFQTRSDSPWYHFAYADARLPPAKVAAWPGGYEEAARVIPTR